jgi:hypothetical protein
MVANQNFHIAKAKILSHTHIILFKDLSSLYNFTHFLSKQANKKKQVKLYRLVCF